MKNSCVLLLLVSLCCSCGQPPKLKVYTPDWQTINFDIDYHETVYDFGVNIDRNPGPDGQEAGTNHSFIGNYARALQWFDLGDESVPAEDAGVDSILQSHQFISAHDYIVERADKHEVTIINEAHHISYHRIFTKSLLQNLYDLGYRHFGLETLDNNNTEKLDLLNTKGIVTHTTGYYIKDPQFAELLREAHRIGFKLFSYESHGNSGNIRERDQGENILAYRNAHPDGKILIHCGYGHANEVDLSPENYMMAGHVAQLLGTDPLTINQTSYSERSELKFDKPIYRSFNAERPSVLVNDAGKSYSPWDNIGEVTDVKIGMDIYVFHPSIKLLHGRPAYLFDDQKKARKVNLSKAKLSYPALVYVYRKGDDFSTTVPFDVLETSTPEVVLGLPEGDFELVLNDISGTQKSASLKIK